MVSLGARSGKLERSLALCRKRWLEPRQHATLIAIVLRVRGNTEYAIVGENYSPLLRLGSGAPPTVVATPRAWQSSTAPGPT